MLNDGRKICDLTNGEVNEFLKFLIFLFYSVRMWDIRPFAPLERCLKVFTGAQHNFEKVLTVLFIKV